eukprot:m.91251 g.91251  ORF g.91251 m.91251 type:complete len:218 (-) comp8866_c0_seq2:1565-2218(-)
MKGKGGMQYAVSNRFYIIKFLFYLLLHIQFVLLNKQYFKIFFYIFCRSSFQLNSFLRTSITQNRMQSLLHQQHLHRINIYFKHYNVEGGGRVEKQESCGVVYSLSFEVAVSPSFCFPFLFGVVFGFLPRFFGVVSAGSVAATIFFGRPRAFFGDVGVVVVVVVVVAFCSRVVSLLSSFSDDDCFLAFLFFFFFFFLPSSSSSSSSLSLSSSEEGIGS